MIRKQPSPNPEHVRVGFEMPAIIWADRVYLVGDFNGWDVTATPMHQDRDGYWRAYLDLPANRRYQFRYWINGQWYTDHAADGFQGDSPHTIASVVETTLPTGTGLPLHTERQPSTRKAA